MNKLMYGIFKTGQPSVHLSESESLNWRIYIYVQATFNTWDDSWDFPVFYLIVITVTVGENSCKTPTLTSPSLSPGS